MSTLPNATNLAPGTSYFGSGGGGGDVFPQGIQLGTHGLTLNEGSIYNPADYQIWVVDSNNNTAKLVNSDTYSGSYSTGYFHASAVSIDYAQPLTGEGYTLAKPDTVNKVFALSNVSSINGAAPGGGLSVNDITAHLGGSNQVDPNSTTALASASVSGLPTGSNILVQASIGLGGLTGSNVLGYFQYGIGFSNAEPVYSPPIWVDTSGFGTQPSSITICGILANASTTNTLLIIGSNAANNSCIANVSLDSIKMTVL